MRRLALFLLSVSVIVAGVHGFGSNSSPSVLLRDVSALTFHAGARTTGRRTSPVPQLSCVGGGACKPQYEPSTVQCTNVGYDGDSIQWRCEAELDRAVKFGDVTVGCEGYHDSNDERVLRGSCGLEYELLYTGEKQSGSRYFSSSTSRGYESGSSSGFWSIIFAVGLAYLLFKMCVSARPAMGAPPSYSQSQYGSNYGGNYGPNYCPPGTGAGSYGVGSGIGSGIGGGWWGGAATGGMLGYLLGRRKYAIW
mgnify:CR=1 FL=1